MEVDATSKDVWTRKTLEAELRTICTATDRLYARWNTTLLHGTEHDVDDMHVWIYLLLHVVVLVVDFCRNSSLAVLLVQLQTSGGRGRG